MQIKNFIGERSGGSTRERFPTATLSRVRKRDGNLLFFRSFLKDGDPKPGVDSVKKILYTHARQQLSPRGVLVPDPSRGGLLPGDGVSHIRDSPSADRDRLSFRSGIYYRETIRRAGFRPGPGFARCAGCIDSRNNESIGDGNHGSTLVQAARVERTAGSVDHSGHGRCRCAHRGVRGRTIFGRAADYARRRGQRERFDRWRWPHRTR